MQNLVFLLKFILVKKSCGPILNRVWLGFSQIYFCYCFCTYKGQIKEILCKTIWGKRHVMYYDSLKFHMFFFSIFTTFTNNFPIFTYSFTNKTLESHWTEAGHRISLKHFSVLHFWISDDNTSTFLFDYHLFIYSITRSLNMVSK